MTNSPPPRRLIRLLPPLMVAFLALAAGSTAHAQRQAQSSWWDRAPARWSAHYLIKTDLPAEQAQAFAHHLDLMYEEYSRRLAALPARAPEKLSVYIFARQDEYLRTLRMRWGVDATGTGGMFFVVGAGSGLAFWTESLPARRIQHVIQHEGFHQFAWSRFGADLPMWANEGLAEFFGQAVLVNDGFLLGQMTPRAVENVQEAVELSTYVPFRDMLSMSGKQWMEKLRDDGPGIKYEQAWSMVHFLIYGEGGRYQEHFKRYLRLLNNAMTPELAFREVFGEDVEAFETSWKRHAAAARPSAFITALERIEFLAEGALELSRRGGVPESIEELRDALRTIEFAHAVGHHVPPVTLDAADDGNFEIPMDHLTSQQPLFAVEKPRLIGLTHRQRRQEEQRPTPCTLQTKHLRPGDLRVRWIRDRETTDIRYEIIVR